MKSNNCKDEIIRFVMNSSDLDNFIIATFIAGMQAKKNMNSSELHKAKQGEAMQSQNLQENHSL